MAPRLSVELHHHLTKKQRAVLNDKSSHLILTGVAGTGKTYTAMARGLQRLEKEEVTQIIIVRSAVPTRDLGFLPGDLDEKIDPFADAYDHLASQISPKMNYNALVSKGIIRFVSTSFLRGVTFDDAYILVDEYQNMSAHELHTIATRVGQQSQLVVCGDSDQSDLKGAESREHGVIIQVLERMLDSEDGPVFGIHRFGVEDIVRSGFVRSYYEARAT